MATLSFGSQSVITGGTFTQVNNDLQERPQTPWDRLQAAVAPAAFHNSDERFDPPRCHPNTRVAVMDELIDWVIRKGDAGHARVVWLSGAAGAGKSAIAQSLCELCFSQHFLLATFFFNRSDSSRNNPKRLVATITYQIYGMVPPRYQSLILEVIKNDPLVFDRSIEAQFKALIMNPLRDLFDVDYFNNYDAPRLIVLDGLDECSTAAAQVKILTALQTISKQFNTPFIFLIASRPEHDIQMFFKSSSLGSLIRRLDLDDSYLPDLDIELFLREKIQETCVTHPLKGSIPREWPSDEAIQAIVRKSSGQFIYASVVVKYVTSSRHYPPNRLDVVRQLRPPKRDLPFVELDALYSHILSSVEDVTLVLRILHIVLLIEDSTQILTISTVHIEQLCELDQSECLSVLYDLQSVLEVDLAPKQSIRLLHKSLLDYLKDPARSHKYYIDTTPTTAIPILTQSLRLICDPKCDIDSGWYLVAIWSTWKLDLLFSNIQQCHEDLISFSLLNCWKTYRRTQRGDKSRLMHDFVWFPSYFLDKLCLLEGTHYTHIFYHHLNQFSNLVDHLSVACEGTSAEDQERSDRKLARITILVLWGRPDTHIPLKFLQQLRSISFDVLHRIPWTNHIYSHDVSNLYCSAARRCINVLLHDNNPKSSAFSLELLLLILPHSSLTSELNEACLPRNPFASYAATGDHGLSALASSAYVAMQEYRERYAKKQRAHTD